jgi:hypothetical protein
MTRIESNGAAKARRARLWLVLGTAAVALFVLLGRDSILAERLYSRGIFVAWRWAWDYSLGLSPIPWLYIILAAVATGGVVRLVRFFSRPRREIGTPRRKRIGPILFTTAAWAGKLVFLFYALWGFNYNRVGIEKQWELAPAPLNSAELAAEAAWASQASIESRSSILNSSADPLGAAALPTNLESHLRNVLVPVLREAGYPAPGRVRVRSFSPGGWMMRFSSTGVYIPFFGEGYTANNLLPFEKPFTIAHEMVHGYGITDEGAANFLAFLACAASPLPVVKYSGFAAYWEYAAGELSRAAPAEFKALWDRLPEGMKADIRLAQKNAARYRGALEKVSQKVYAKYLKSQGIDDGLRSYSRFVGLVAAWKKKNGLPTKAVLIGKRILKPIIDPE